MNNKHCISLYANLEEEARIDFLKKKLRRGKGSEVLREAIIRVSDAEGFVAPSNGPSDTMAASPKLKEERR